MFILQPLQFAIYIEPAANEKEKDRLKDFIKQVDTTLKGIPKERRYAAFRMLADSFSEVVLGLN